MTKNPATEVLPELICRVCHGEGTDTSPLQYPCQCAGSIRFIHKECLTKWLNVSGREVCEVCGHKFIYKNLYKDDMPHSLPISIMMSGLCDLCCYFISAILWISVLPCMVGRIIQHMLFLSPIDGVGHLLTHGLTTAGLGSAFLLGVLVCVSFGGIIWGLSLLRPAIIRHRCQELFLNTNEDNPPDNTELVENEVDEDENSDTESDSSEDYESDEAQNDDHQLAPNNRFRLPRINRNVDGEPMNELLEDVDWSVALGFDCRCTYLIYMMKYVTAFVSFVFLINTFFFIGSMCLESLQLLDYILPLFREVLSVVIGHIIMAFVMFQINRLFKYQKHQRFCYLSGLFYIMLKFTIYIVNKVFIFPILCGLFMSTAMGQLLGTSLSFLVEEFTTSPCTTLITHWLQGHIFNMCICQFIIETRRSLRSGIIWFFIDFEDPELNPIKNIVTGSVRGHLSGFIYSSLYFCFTILLVIWLPLSLLQFIYPNLTFQLDTSISRVLIERLALPFFLMCWLYPGLLFKLWCEFCAHRMDLTSYLFGNVKPTEGDLIVHADGSITHAERDNITLTTRRTHNCRNYLFTEYIRPATWFRVRVAVFVLLTSILVSLLCLVNYATSLLLTDFLERLTPGWNLSRVLYFAAALFLHEMFFKLALKYCVAGDPNHRLDVINQFRDYIFYIVMILVGLTIVFFIPFLVGHLLDITVFKPWEFIDTSVDRFVIKWLIGLQAALTLLPMVVIFCYLDLLYSGRNPRDIDIKQFIEKAFKSLCRSILILTVSLLISYLLNQGVFLLLNSEYKSYSEIFQPYITICIYAIAIFSDCSNIWKKFCVKVRDDRYLLGRELLNYSATDLRI